MNKRIKSWILWVLVACSLFLIVILGNFLLKSLILFVVLDAFWGIGKEVLPFFCFFWILNFSFIVLYFVFLFRFLKLIFWD